MKSQEAQCRGLHTFAVGVLASAVLLAYAPAQAAQPDSDPGPGAGVQTFRFLKGRVLVKPKPGLSNEELDELIKPHGGRRSNHIPELDVHMIELPRGASEVAVARALKNHPFVKFAELDEQVEPTLLANDPYYAQSWHLPKVGAPLAWDASVGSGVTIAVLDSGVDGTHPELSPHMVPGWNMYDNNSNTADVLGHGTMVAGIAAATTNNGVGVSGLSFGSKIMPIRICDTSGYAYFSTIAQAINWAADHGAKVANISWDGAGSSTIQQAAQYMRGKGGVVVMSAGNRGILETLAPSDAITVVSATDSSDTRTSWSSYGGFVDVAAPGIGIITTSRAGNYASAWGTSMSAPIVSATYAMMMSANPNLSSPTLDSVLFTSVLDLGTAGKDQSFGHGRVRTDAAVNKARLTVETDSQLPVTSITSPASGKVNGSVTVSATATDNVAVTKVELYSGTTLIATDTSSPYGFVWDSTKSQDGIVSLTTKAYDAAGNVGNSAAVSVTVANDAVAPTATIANPAPGVKVSGSVAIGVLAQDNVKVAKIILLIDGKQVAMTTSSSLSYSWTVPSPKGSKVTSGTSKIVAQAYDAAGNVGSASVTVSK